ncbi:hypothetical protein DH2020_024333 [Rehmannia glutinosa]|uniref:Nucleoplasmin-like domain-containing protein n=1 Tax=Rehmannia glutinosa TaxID=99300 RepID=A0ABR0W2N1_REHGL
MEFWGVEVKPGVPLKVQPEFGKLIHISQAALGEVKDAKAAKNVPLRMKIDGKNFIIGSLSAEDRTQLMFDLVFEREFELSHDWKNGSVYFIGYIADDPVSDGEDLSDDFEDESEDELVGNQENGEIKPKSEDAKAAKGPAAAAKPANGAAVAKATTKKEEQSDSDDDEDDDESDSDEEMALDGLAQGDSSDDVSGEDSEEDDSSEEELPKNVQQSKKRPAESAKQTPISAKKPKASTPEKTGNKKGHNATPFPSKPAGKTPPGKKPNQQTPKSGGQFSGKSGNKSFNSKNAKGRHGGK